MGVCLGKKNGKSIDITRTTTIRTSRAPRGQEREYESWCLRGSKKKEYDIRREEKECVYPRQATSERWLDEYQGQRGQKTKAKEEKARARTPRRASRSHIWLRHLHVCASKRPLAASSKSGRLEPRMRTRQRGANKPRRFPRPGERWPGGYPFLANGYRSKLADKAQAKQKQSKAKVVENAQCSR
jgi:hypothetical protein